MNAKNVFTFVVELNFVIYRAAGTVVGKQTKLVAVVIWRDTVELSVSIKTGRITTKYVVADRQIRLLWLTRTYPYVRPVVHVPEHL